jgi:hypothetical protein
MLRADAFLFHVTRPWRAGNATGASVEDKGASGVAFRGKD